MMPLARQLLVNDRLMTEVGPSGTLFKSGGLLGDDQEKVATPQNKVGRWINQAIIISFNSDDNHIVGTLKRLESLLKWPVYISWWGLYTVDLVPPGTRYEFLNNPIYGRVFEGEGQQFACQVSSIHYHITASAA